MEDNISSWHCVHVSHTPLLVKDAWVTCLVGFPEYPECGGEEFQCRSGQCVPLSGKCDKLQDCQDGSDEDNCGRAFSANIILCPTQMTLIISYAASSFFFNRWKFIIMVEISWGDGNGTRINNFSITFVEDSPVFVLLHVYREVFRADVPVFWWDVYSASSGVW